MGFLKFLKRQKRNDDDLDLPPAPPPLEAFDEDELPDVAEFGKPSDLEELPNLDFPEEEKIGLDEELPDLPDIPDIEEERLPDIRPVTAYSEIPKPPYETPSYTKEPIQIIPKYTMPKPSKELEQEPKHEKRLFSRMPSEKTVYVKVDNFKSVLGSINMVRSDLRKSEEALVKLEGIKSSKDRSLDRAKSSLDDLQRKIVYIEKTLFKGE